MRLTIKPRLVGVFVVPETFAPYSKNGASRIANFFSRPRAALPRFYFKKRFIDFIFFSVIGMYLCRMSILTDLLRTLL